MNTYEVEVGLRDEGYSKRTVTVMAVDEEDARARAKKAYMLQVEAKIIRFESSAPPVTFGVPGGRS